MSLKIQFTLQSFTAVGLKQSFQLFRIFTNIKKVFFQTPHLPIKTSKAAVFNLNQKHQRENMTLTNLFSIKNQSFLKYNPISLDNYILMLEPKQNNHFQFNDDNMQLPPPKSQLKLPKIQRPTSKNQTTLQYSDTKFPSLKIDSSPLITDSVSQLSQNYQLQQPQTLKPISGNYSRKKTQNQPDREDFVIEVEKKLKMVLEEQNIMDLEESDNNSQDDFEKKIIQNKELIKQHKLKKETEIHPNNFVNSQPPLPIPINPVKFGTKKQKPTINSNNNLKTRSRNESLYEKRAREYRDASMENKFLMKKKENVAIKLSKQMTMKEGRSKQSLSFNKIMPDRSIDRDKQKIHFQKVIEKEKERFRQPSPYYSSPQAKKNEQLFDNIQNFLENPKKSEGDLHTIKSSQNLGKTRKQLQQQLRKMQAKLKQKQKSTSQNQNQASENNDNEDARTSFNTQYQQDNKPVTPPRQQLKLLAGTIQQWKKIQLRRSNIMGHIQTNFEKEIERINHYLQRNQESLDKYIDQQKLLVEMDLWKKMKSKPNSSGSNFEQDKTDTANTEG